MDDIGKILQIVNETWVVRRPGTSSMTSSIGLRNFSARAGANPHDGSPSDKVLLNICGMLVHRCLMRLALPVINGGWFVENPGIIIALATFPPNLNYNFEKNRY